MTLFREKYTLEERVAEGLKIRQKYPDRVPVIVETSQIRKYLKYSEKLPELDKKKYLVPDSLTVAQFMYVIRKRIKLPSEKAIFMHYGNNKAIVPTSDLMSVVYEEHKDEEDGFLYCQVVGENTFG